MTIRPALLCAAAALALTGTAAYAQDSDVLVMRRAVSQPKDPNTLKPVEGSNLNDYYWVTSGWLRGEPACSSSTEQSRLRGCVYQGQQANEANCPQPAPAKTRLVEDYRACEYEWTITGTGEWAESCSDTTRPVTSECRRQDGEKVDDVYCSAMPKPSVEKGFNEAGCTYEWGIGEWGNWKSQCSAETTRERKVECVRSNGSVAPDQLCSDPKPDTFEPGENYSNCTYRWVPSAWQSDEQSCGGEVRQTRTVSCQRTDGQEADPSLCVDPVPDLEQTAPDYGACSFSWETEEWGEWNSQCSTQSMRRRTVFCQREDGKTVTGDNCGPGRPAEEETAEILTGCGYEWQTGEWTTTPQCSAAAESTRPVTCHRTDGLKVDDSLCNAANKPADSKTIGDYSNCTYSWKSTPTQWDSACSDEAHGTRTVSCERSDGTKVADQQCIIANKPSASLTEPRYDGCPADWASGEWGEWSSQCSDSSKRSRLIQCIQNRPSGDASVTAENCDQDTRPAKDETSAIWSGCVADWSTSSWGWNGTIGAKSSTCSASPKQERTVECKKRLAPDGVSQVVDASECSTPKPDTEQTLPANYDGCTYEWNPGPWSDWDSLCSPNARRTRTTQCLRLDGSNTAVSGSNCDPYDEGAKTEEIQEVVIDCGSKLKNSGFEEGFAEWYTNGSSIIVNDSYEGDKAAHIKGMITQTITVNATTSDTISLSLMCKEGGRLPWFRVQFLATGMNTQLVTYRCDGTTWQKQSHSFKPNIPVEDVLLRIFPVDGSTTGAIIDNVLVKVN